MMKGIRLKKFNELRIRLNDRNALGFGRNRKESSTEKAALKEIDARVSYFLSKFIKNI